MCKWCGILALLCGPLCLAAYSAAEQELGRTAALEIRASLDSGQYAQAVNDIESTLQRVEEQLRGYEGQAIPTSLMGDYVRLTTLLSTAGSRLLADTRAAMTPEDKAALETRLAQAMEQAAVRIQHCAASEPRLSAHMEDAASLFTDAAVLLSGSGRTDRAGTCIQTAVNLTEQMASLEQAGGGLVIWQLDRRLFTREFLACFITHAGDDPKDLYNLAESIIRKYASAEWICKTLLTLEHRLPGRQGSMDPLARYQYLALLERCLRDNTNDKTLPQLYYELGALADLLGLAPDRVKWYRRLIEIDPNSNFGSTAKQLLEAQVDPVLDGYVAPPPLVAERGDVESVAPPVASSSTMKDTNQPGSLIGPADSLRPSRGARAASGEAIADGRRTGTVVLLVSAGVVLLLLPALIQKGVKWRQAMHGRCS